MELDVRFSGASGTESSTGTESPVRLFAPTTQFFGPAHNVPKIPIFRGDFRRPADFLFYCSATSEFSTI